MDTPNILTEVGTGVTQMLGWLGDVVQSIFSGELSALLPVFALAIAGTCVMFGVKILRSFTYGA